MNIGITYQLPLVKVCPSRFESFELFFFASYYKA